MNILLRLSLWFLLTANFGITNILIGLAVAFLLPAPRRHSSSVKDWLHAFRDVAIAIPQAYKEAFEMIFFPHRHEAIVAEPTKPKRSSGLIFLDIFVITFTPKTIVTRHHKEGWYDVHYVKRKAD